MAANARQRGRDKVPRHVRLYHWILETPAWRSLSANARAIYIEIASRYAGVNNGRISYSVREAADALHIGKTTAALAMGELVQQGFIVAREKGAFSLKKRHATEWRLTEFDCDVTKERASKDFMRWALVEKKPVPETGLSVPETGPVGTCSGTDVAKTSRNGTCSGTVSAKKASPRYLRRDTDSIPGGTASNGEAHAFQQLGTVSPLRAGAPEGSAVARSQAPISQRGAVR